MKLGLLTDIHEHVEYLRLALDRLAVEQVDQVVVLGDLFLMGERIDETCALLDDAGAIGVWGNHAIFDTNTRHLSPFDIRGAAHDGRASSDRAVN